MKFLIGIFLLISVSACGQEAPLISHFSVWKPKYGQTVNFESGYKQHLLWHKANNDLWNWYGWFIISGPRDGMFIDATFNHSWHDFDLAKNPAGDGTDNQLHTEPFADFQKGYKLALLPFSDQPGKTSLQTRYARMLTIGLKDLTAATRQIERVAKTYKQRNPGRPLLVFKMIDGGNTREIILLMGLDSFAEYNKTQDLLDELSKADERGQTIKNVISETLLFKKDMSLNID